MYFQNVSKNKKLGLQEGNLLAPRMQEQLRKSPSRRENGQMMINKDGTLNFNMFSKRSQFKESTYQNEPKVEQIYVNNEDIQESELQTKEVPRESKPLNFNYKYNSPNGSPVRKTVTKEARSKHAGYGNIVGNFMKGGNAQMLIQSKPQVMRPLESRLQENTVRSGPREESLAFAFSTPKDLEPSQPSEFKQSYNSKSRLRVL
jgi:hypothetical protein